MHGQTFEQFSRDIEYATSMGTPTMELYPISNVVTQASLHTPTRRAVSSR